MNQEHISVWREARIHRDIGCIHVGPQCDGDTCPSLHFLP